MPPTPPNSVQQWAPRLGLGPILDHDPGAYPVECDAGLEATTVTSATVGPSASLDATDVAWLGLDLVAALRRQANVLRRALDRKAESSDGGLDGSFGRILDVLDDREPGCARHYRAIAGGRFALAHSHGVRDPSPTPRQPHFNFRPWAEAECPPGCRTGSKSQNPNSESPGSGSPCGVGARAAVWAPDTGRKRGRARAAGGPREAGQARGETARRGDSLFSAAPAAQGHGVRTGGARLPVLPPRPARQRRLRGHR